MLTTILAFIFVAVIMFFPTLRALVVCSTVYEKVKVFSLNLVLVGAMYSTDYLDKIVDPNNVHWTAYVTLLLTLFSYIILSFTDEK